MQIGTFIQQYLLDNKLTKDLPNLAEVSVAAWCLINTIYKFGWNRLSADNNNKSIWQCMSGHFARTPKAMPTGSKPSPPQNSLKSKKINSIKSIIEKSYT